MFELVSTTDLFLRMRLKVMERMSIASQAHDMLLHWLLMDKKSKEVQIANLVQAAAKIV